MSIGLSLDDVRARHAALVAEREREQQAFHDRDIGFSFVLGELEQMIAELERREAEAEQLAQVVAERERLEAEQVVIALAESEAGAEC